MTRIISARFHSMKDLGGPPPCEQEATRPPLLRVARDRAWRLDVMRTGHRRSPCFSIQGTWAGSVLQSDTLGMPLVSILAPRFADLGRVCGPSARTETQNYVSL